MFALGLRFEYTVGTLDQNINFPFLLKKLSLLLFKISACIKFKWLISRLVVNYCRVIQC